MNPSLTSPHNTHDTHRAAFDTSDRGIGRHGHAPIAFAQRLARRHDGSPPVQEAPDAREAARVYRRDQAAIAEGPQRCARRFDVAAHFLQRGPELPHPALRHRALADALVRSGSVVPMPGRPDIRLLCDLEGQPLLAFLPSPGPGSAIRASLVATLEERLRVDHGLSLGIGRPVSHALPGMGDGHLIAMPAPLSLRQQQAISAQRNGEIGAAAMFDLALREAVRDMPPRELQTLALRRLFTNDWQAGWDRLVVDVHGRCCPLDFETTFPDHASLLLSLSAMQRLNGLAPVFRIPEDAGPAWDAPLDPTLVDKLRRIDPHALQSDWTRQLTRELTRRSGSSPDSHAPLASARVAQEATRRSVDGLRVVQTLIAEDPVLSLRRLLERFPHRLTWLDERPAARQRDPLVASEPQARRADPPQFISDADLSSWLRHYAPFNPFKRRDRTIAPLLRDAIGLRLKTDGPQRQRAAEKLRRAAIHAANTLSRGLEGLRSADARRIEADNKRLETLWHLITDTENRYQLAPPDLLSEPVKPAGRSWLPWRRRTQAQP